MPVVNVTEIFSKDAHTKLPFEQTIDALIEGYPCVAFSKSYCPYNGAVKDLLALNYGILLLVIDINQAGSASDIQRYLQSKTGIATVPQVFVDGKYLGNHDSIMELHAKKLLRDRLGQHAKRDGSRPGDANNTTTAPCGYRPLFWFPPTINKWAIRATGLLSFAASTLLAVQLLTLREGPNWVCRICTILLFLDFLLRFFSGSRVAPIAQLGGKLASIPQLNLSPIPRPGAPKQFASFCGTTFSGLGALAFNYYNSPTTGAVFLTILAICTGMEGALDYCLGCKFFAIADSVLASRIKKVDNGTKRPTPRAA